MAVPNTLTAEESSLSSWAGPYVTEMLGRGQALASMPYQAYMGPLTAGQSQLQQQAFQGLANLAVPTTAQTTYDPMSFTGMAPTAPTTQQTVTGGMDYDTSSANQLVQRLSDLTGFRDSGTRQISPMFAGARGPDDRPLEGSRPATQEEIERFRATSQPGGLGTIAGMAQQQPMQQQSMQQSPIEQYMSPYLQGALDPQYAAAQRQSDIAAQKLQSQFGKAGAYGGSRQGVAEAELQRGLLDRMAGITGAGYQTAFEQAQKQFNTEQDRQMQAAQQAQRYGLDVLREQQTGGGTQRAIEAQGIAADIAQFEQERDYPKSNTLFMQSLLQGLPLETQSYSYYEPSGLQSLAGGANDIQSILDLLNPTKSNQAGGTAATPQYDMNALANYKSSYMATGMDENAATLQAMRDIGMIS